jgi:predicted nucleic-acid-binding Zn-ribbon protein
MALSTCPKCGNHSFALHEKEPTGSTVKWFFVQCSSCGAPVGVVDFYPNSTVIKRIEALEKAVKSLTTSVATIDHNVRALAQR